MGQLDDQKAYDMVDKLFKMAVRGDWQAVIKDYARLSNLISDNCDIASAKCETALHVAVAKASEETEHVSEIMEVIPEGDLPKILRMRNRRGNTPLHLAATMGKKDICWLIASKGKSLIAERNEQGETPLFLAAHRGHEDAFFYLEFEFTKKDVPMDMLKNKSDNRKDVPMDMPENKSDNKKDVPRDMLINKSGNTVLHSAICGQNYRLAIRILESYPNLAKEVNEKGLTPLHVLALQHRTFESSFHHQGLFDRIFYHCMIIRKETWEDRKDIKDIEGIVGNRKSPKCPKNYRTCFDIYEMLKGFFVKTRPLLKSCRGCGASGETMSLEGGGIEKKYVRKKEKRFTEKWGPSTTICDVVYEIFHYVSSVPLHFLLSERLLSIAKRKKIHKLAEQLLNELLDKTCSWEVAVEEKSTATPSTSKTTNDAPSQVAGQGNGKSVATNLASPEKKEEGQRQQQGGQQQESTEPCVRGETPLLTAARLGIEEMVKSILDKLGQQQQGQGQQQQESTEPCVRRETPLLTAARLGIEEMVKAILDKFPEAIEDEDRNRKNAVLLAVEHRQIRVYLLLEKMTTVKESVFCQVDTEGNSALHLASRYNPERPWSTPGPALQMKWEITWHQYVRNSVPSNTFAYRNKDGKTARKIFIESHEDLKKEAREWLKNTCTAYSLISTLIATVAFTTSSSIPGDYDNGKPALEPEFAFSVFSISSLIALCTSLSATVFFVAILVTRHEQEDFAVKVPSRLQLGLTFLFASIASILVSFSSGFYFSVRNKLENAAYPIFAAMCLPVTLFAVAQLPLYLGLTRRIFFNPKDKIQHYDHGIDTH